MAARRRLALPAADAARVLSPVRQEILSAIGLYGPCSARELAAQLGRAVTSLYYHLELLERAGAVAQRRRGREVVWRAAASAVTVAAPRVGEAGTSSRATIARAALRLTARELDAALRAPRRRGAESAQGLIAVRSKAWLDARELRALERHFSAIHALLQGTRGARAGASIYAVTLVLAPVAARAASAR